MSTPDCPRTSSLASLERKPSASAGNVVKRGNPAAFRWDWEVHRAVPQESGPRSPRLEQIATMLAYMGAVDQQKAPRSAPIR